MNGLFKLRTDQTIQEGAWKMFVYCAGRGWGKTLALTIWLYNQALFHPNSLSVFIHVTDRTYEYERMIQVAEHIGVLPVKASRHQGIQLANGSRILLNDSPSYTNHDSDLRGLNPQFIACDEWGIWRNRLALFSEIMPLIARGAKAGVALTPLPDDPLLARLQSDPRVMMIYSHHTANPDLPAYLRKRYDMNYGEEPKADA